MGAAIKAYWLGLGRSQVLGRAFATVTLVSWATLSPFSALAQITGPLIPPSLPSSPQPLFPTLPSPPSSPGAAPQSRPPPASPPETSRAPAVSARTQRVTVTDIERQSERVFLRAQDDSGTDLLFEVADYTAVLAADASRVAIGDLRPTEPIEVTWFPQGTRRTLLTIRRLR